MRHHRRLAALLGAAVLAVGACSVPEDDAASPIAADRIPQLSPSRTMCPDLRNVDTDPVKVFFVAQREETRVLTPVDRDVPAPATAERALQRLLQCPPDEAERDQGFATQLSSIVFDGFREVDLSQGQWEVALRIQQGSTGQERQDLSATAVAQILFTVTNDDFGEVVREVRFRVDGELSRVPTDGATLESGAFVTRRDFPNSAPTTTTTPPTTVTTTTEPPVDTVTDPTADPAVDPGATTTVP